MRRFFALIAFLLLAGAARADPIVVFAAASLKDALDAVVHAYEANGQDHVSVSYSGSNALGRQIENGAPADIFISADEEWIDYVVQRNLALAGSRTDLLANDLVLIAPAASKVQLKLAPGVNIAAALGNGRIALANPDAVPAGKYAKAAFTALGAWSAIESKVAATDNVRGRPRPRFSRRGAARRRLSHRRHRRQGRAHRRYVSRGHASAGRVSDGAPQARDDVVGHRARSPTSPLPKRSSRSSNSASGRPDRCLRRLSWGILTLSLKVALWGLAASLPFAIAVAFVLARKDFPGKTLFDALRAPAAGAAAGRRRLCAARAFRHPGSDREGAERARHRAHLPLDGRRARRGDHGLSADGARDPPGDRSRGSAPRVGGAHAGREPHAGLLHGHAAARDCPGVVTGALLAFARALGEFGATITFVSNIPGETRTLPLAIYTFTQVPGGDAQALRLSIFSVVLSLAALAFSEWLVQAPRSDEARVMLDVDISVRRGTFALKAAFRSDAPIVALFGRSGSGKSTLVNAIAGIVQPERGRIVIGDRALYDSERGIDLAPEKRRVGCVFQDALLFPHLDVRANLALRRTPHARRASVSSTTSGSSRCWASAGLLDRRPTNLSGGEKQRVAIGRALLASPRILLLDEPLASLDGARKAEILAYIEVLRDELRLPMVYVSHAIEEVTRLADRVVVIADGAVVAEGNTVEALSRHERHAHRALRGRRRDRSAASPRTTRLRAHHAHLRRRPARRAQHRCVTR